MRSEAQLEEVRQDCADMWVVSNARRVPAHEGAKQVLSHEALQSYALHSLRPMWRADPKSGADLLISNETVEP